MIEESKVKSEAFKRKLGGPPIQHSPIFILQWPVPSIPDSPPDHFERCRRGKIPHALAVSRKTEFSHLRAALVGEGDEYQSDGLLRRSSARAGDAGNAQSDGRARIPPNSLGEGNGDGF
jgi:hypothetical protein